MMRNVGLLAVGLLALVVAAACVPTSEPGQPVVAAATASPQPVATLDSGTNSPTAAPTLPTPAATGGSTGSETAAPLRENVAAAGHAVPSSGEESAHLAIDGDLDSLWNSNRVPLGWFTLAFDDLYLVDRVELVIAQTPAGPTTHEVWLGNGSGTRTLYKRFTDLHTEDGQTLDVAIEPPRSINEVLIRTLKNPSWVAWREVRVFGTLSANPMAAMEWPRLQLTKIAAGLELPVQITHAGDSSGRLFVVEQKGRIRIIRNGAAPNSGASSRLVEEAPFLDISARVGCCGERGLLGVAFPPAYAASRRFYVSYTNTNGDTVISRYTTTADPDRADPDSEEVVLTIDQPYNTHNGGRMAFGPQDGYLYIGSGDGGGPAFNDPDNLGQNPSTLLGKLLRIDVESGFKPYGIPAGNPSSATMASNLNLARIDGYRGEIWALGLRNPWGFAFDQQTGDLYIPDVGNLTREEVNYQPAASAGGENYGWRITEGSICFQQWGCTADSPCLVEHWLCSAEGLTSPVADYDRSQGCAIVGGAVYRGASARMQGIFFYADFCTGRIWGLKRPGSENGAPYQDFQDAWQSSLLIKASLPVSSIGEDEEGNVYIAGYQDGVISMITER